MEIGSVHIQPMKPSQPAAPTPPPGGNIENRQPPAEPSAPVPPTGPSADSGASAPGISANTTTSGLRGIDVYA